MIYYVEDDQSIRELVLYALRNSGFVVEGFDTGKSFYTAIDKKIPQLVLLDIMLPDADGIEILKTLRQGKATKKIPVIMLTAKTAEYDRVIGLDLGADDYISKPFGMMELVSRVKALLRRTAVEEDAQVYAYENVRLNLDSRVVQVDGSAVELTYKEFELLHLLLKNAGRVISRDLILDHVWGYDHSDETRTVDVHIRTLRKKLGTGSGIIETIKGVGYRIGGGTV